MSLSVCACKSVNMALINFSKFDIRESNRGSFKFRDKERISDFAAVLLSGPPGIGKTTAAHVVAKTNGYEALEFNASDVRSKKILEVCISSS